MGNLNPVPPGSPHFRAPRSPGSGNSPPMRAIYTMIMKPEFKNRTYSFSNLPRFSNSQPQPCNQGPPGRTKNKTNGTKIKPKIKPDLRNNKRSDKTYPGCPNISRSTTGDPQQPYILAQTSSTHSDALTKSSTPRPKIQKSIKDFITKGKKRLHSVQLTADVTKKSNTRLIPTNRDNTVDMIREILRDIIYSEYPLKISPIFAHLKSKKKKKRKK